ncbi:MAG: glycosyltransferase family 2 protein [Thermoleophilaceae bacterium]|nr:glycosyltransferase family 2 protein [Thermoleophilaceae bacterium]
MHGPPEGVALDEKLDRITEILRAIADEEPETRRRLRRLRDSDVYRNAFAATDPLVSIVIPTYRNVEAVRSVSLPSALAQTHQNIEVLVVGDAAPEETAAAVAACGDERVRFENLPLRGPYPDDTERAWLLAGTPPFNAGVALARGAWIAPLGDDDSMAPRHVETLLGAALERRLELVYSRLTVHLLDGTTKLAGEFPPRLGEFGLQSALYLSGLSFMELNLQDELFGEPNDWSLCRRMLRAGVRMGMVDEATVDYHPSRWGGPKPRVDPRDAQLAQSAATLAAANERADELERRLATIYASRSWRMTGPLRLAARRLRRS